MLETISNRTEITVRFSECDPLGMVWHGNYIRYFEDGREAFGKQYDIGYWDIYSSTKLAVPLVHIECDYKKFVGYGEKIIIETKFINTAAAKIIFEYTLFNEKNQIVCTGKSIQVFLDAEKKELIITNPTFFEDWKKKHLG